MQKIISLFARNYDGDRLVRDEIVPGAEWVIAGEGVATIKYDGTCCMIRGGKLYKRYDAKKGKTPPAGFEPGQDAPDPVTGHWPGWLLVGDGPEDKWHREAWQNGTPWCFSDDFAVLFYRLVSPPDGTYELCGPSVQGNPEGFYQHALVPHGAAILPDAPRDFAALRAYLADPNRASIEGIVWHHPDGRMVKIKAKDFGIKRPSIVPTSVLVA
jgi:hypothetical protein